MLEPTLIQGDIAVDDRGSVSFVNGFGFEGVKRYYVITNHKVGTVRAWHAHRREAKYVTVLHGAAVVGVVKVDGTEEPIRYVLSAQRPAVLFIPPGYANGFMPLVEHTMVAFFSTATLEESCLDDIRYDARCWDIWDVKER